MWICEFCNNTNDKAQLTFNQIQFVEHLRNTHLYKFNINRNIMFRCSYGHNGQCYTLSDENKILSEFNSEKEYGIHLVRVHLKHSKVSDDNHFNVSDKGCLENSRNYEIVRNPACNTTHKWTLHHSVVNLPAALNDPSNRQLDIFSKTWGESFEKAEAPTCMTLLSPTKLFFAPYIKQVRSSLKYREKMLRKINSEKQQDNAAIQFNQKSEIDSVPKVFFQSDFSLNCKEIFASVIPIFQQSFNNSSSSLSPSSPASQFTLLDNTLTHKFSNGIASRSRNYKWVTDNVAHKMNEKLSHYLDSVEINIAKQVSKKSNSFFEAVSTQDKVQDKIKAALSQISDVRQKLHLSDTKLTRDHLQVLIYAQRKTNMQILLRQLRVIKTVHSAQATIQTLLATNDFSGVLDLIAGTQSIMKIELFADRSSDSSPIMCLKHVWAQLLEMKTFVEKMVQQEFVNTISSQLRLEDDWNGAARSVEIDYEMVPSVLAMMRIVVYNRGVNLNHFVQLYYDDAMEILKTIVKARVVQAFAKSCQDPDCTSSVDDGGTKNLADQMRALDYDQWIGMLEDICGDMVQLLEKVKIGCHTMIETLASHIDDRGLRLHGEGFMLSSDIVGRLRSDLVKLPENIAEAVEQRVMKLVRARAKDGYLERLSASQLVVLDSLLSTVGRTISVSSPSILCSCVHSYAVRLVTRFHNEHREKLILILDTDLWKAADVPHQLQELATQMTSEGGMSVPYHGGPDTSSDTSHEYIEIDHHKFTVVAAALMLFQMMVEYCHCGHHLRHMDSLPELVFTHLLALLDIFNSRSCQLVLGAKARQLVDLETISARNLALTARSLQMVLALTHRVSVHFTGLCATMRPSLYLDLHQTEHRYQEHIDRINTKLVSLIEDRIKIRLSTWTCRPPSPSTETRAICQQLTKLHEAICDVYPPAVETDLFLTIHNLFKTHLRARMRHLNIVMDNGPQHGLVKLEVAYYMTQLAAFGALHKFTDSFSDIWR